MSVVYIVCKFSIWKALIHWFFSYYISLHTFSMSLTVFYVGVKRSYYQKVKALPWDKAFSDLHPLFHTNKTSLQIFLVTFLKQTKFAILVKNEIFSNFLMQHWYKWRLNQIIGTFVFVNKDIIYFNVFWCIWPKNLCAFNLGQKPSIHSMHEVEFKFIVNIDQPVALKILI